MKTNKLLMILCGVMLTVTSLKAQIDPLTAQYYTNEYLGNPAMAGKTPGLMINAGYRKLMSGIPGSPSTQNLSGDYGFNKVGVGLNLYNESAGLQRQTRVVGTFAYHVPLDAGQKKHLSFGLSMGFLNQRLENSDINGNPNDPQIGLYNNRKTYLDGDFGLAYRDERLTVQGSIPNLKNFLKRDVVRLADVSTFYAAAAYKISLTDGPQGAILEPKVAYRGIKDLDNIIDAGVQLSLADQQIFLTGLYHSTKNATFGLGLNYKKKYLISGVYTTETSALSTFSNGNFELNLRLSL